MEFKDLTPEQQDKLKACETPEDILALAKEAGYELDDAELDAIAGGAKNWFPTCPKCGSHRIEVDMYSRKAKCLSCGYEW